MPRRVLLISIAVLAIFFILPASRSIAATGFITNDTPLWTTTGTNTASSSTTTTTSATTRTLQTTTTQSSQTTVTPTYQSVRYGYDELDRLQSAQYEDGTLISYAYDKAGNRTSKSTSSGTLNSLSITATSSGYGSIVPSGTIGVPSGSSQTFFIEQDILMAASSCPSSYTFSYAHNRCEKSPPECPSGYNSFNTLTHQCEQTVTNNYQASCNAGQGSLDTITAKCEYVATLTDGVNYTIPLYQSTISQGFDPEFSFCSPYTGLHSTPSTDSTGTVCPIIGYVSPFAFSGSIPLYQSTILQGSDPGSYVCSPYTGLRSTPSTDSAGSVCPIIGYISPSAFSGSIPLYQSTILQGFDPGFSFCSPYAELRSTPSTDSTGTVCPMIGYQAPTSGVYERYYICPNGGALSGNICQNTPVCPSGGTLSGTTCTVATINTAAPVCTNGYFESSNNLCYSYPPGVLTSLLVDNTAVDLLSLQSMPGGVSPRFYYTFNNVTAPHTITASFIAAPSSVCTNPPARIPGTTPVDYLSLQSAYNSAVNGNTILGNLYDHYESLLFDRDVSVILDGGYNCDFSSISGSMTIKGTMIISKGSVTVNGNTILAAP